MPSTMSEVVNALLTKAQSGSVKWRKPESGDSFHVDFPDMRLQIERQFIPHTGRIYILELLNGQGDAVASVAADRHTPLYLELCQIYDLAQSHFVDADIEKVIEYLS